MWERQERVYVIIWYLDPEGSESWTSLFMHFGFSGLISRFFEASECWGFGLNLGVYSSVTVF